jgi:pimeloyl-ACP methyl ester carboxylesterase
MADVRGSRDILLVDQRGTGGSNPLHCSLQLPALREDAPDTAAIRRGVAACLAELATRADLGAYTTTRAMHDLEHVRSTLGYGPLNLWGVSYGTKAAREYLRPLLVKLALEGDVAAFVPPAQPEPPPIPRGVFYNLTCSEEFPRISDAMIRSNGQGTVIGSGSVLQHLAICRNWPAAPVDSGLWQEARSTVPALIMAGALDHITPPRYARSVAETLPGSRLLIVPSRGHNDFDPCLARIIRQFVVRPDRGRVGAACLRQAPSLRCPTSKAELPHR